MIIFGHNFSITRLVLVKKPASAAAASQIMIDYQVGILASEYQQLQIECKLDAFDKSYHTNWATFQTRKVAAHSTGNFKRCASKQRVNYYII